jgi:hypothetical protein
MSLLSPPRTGARAGNLAARVRQCVISRSATRQASAHRFQRGGRPARARHLRHDHANRRREGIVLETLEQACPPEGQGAQCAFKDSMIH